MAVRQYVGARYVPKFYEFNNGVWQSNTEYEPLTIVQYNGNSYTSKKSVPANIGEPSSNSDYWVATGNYNAQVENYRIEVGEYKSEVDDLSKVVSKYVTPQMYGAKGDGVNDDTNAIQTALNNSSCVHFPAGTYLISNSITIPSNTSIMGSGKANTIIMQKENTNFTLLRGTNNSNHIMIRDIGIDYHAANRSTYPVIFTNCGRVKLYNCYFADVDNVVNEYCSVEFNTDATKAVDTWAHAIELCTFYQTGLNLDLNTDSQIVANEFTCLRNDFAIKSAGGGLVISDNMIIGTIYLENSSGNQINNNFFDGGETHPSTNIVPSISISNGVQFTQITANRFYVTSGCPIQIPSNMSGVAHIQISSNLFQNCDDLLNGLPDIDASGVAASLTIENNMHIRTSYWNGTARVNRTGTERSNAPIILPVSGTTSTDTRALVIGNSVRFATTYAAVQINNAIMANNTPEYNYPNE